MDINNYDEIPLVSIVLPVYNRPEVVKTIESIISQSYKKIEIIIIDNASTDDTVNCITSLKDPRIKVIVNEKNMGQTYSMNRGLKVASGKYIARIDSDDLALPQRIQKQVEYLENNPDCVICGSSVQVIDDYDNKLFILRNCMTDEGIRICQLFRCAFWHPSVMLRTSVIKDNNIFYDEKIKIAEDYDMWARLLNYGSGHNINEVLTYYRRGNNNDSKKYIEQMWREAQEIKLRERKLLPDGIIKTLLLKEYEIENKKNIYLLDVIKSYHLYKKVINNSCTYKDDDYYILLKYIKIELLGLIELHGKGIERFLFYYGYIFIKKICERVLKRWKKQ